MNGCTFTRLFIIISFGEANLYMSNSKSILIFRDKETLVIRDICNLFAITSIHCNEGFVYLGFRLKPNKYGINDWDWLIDRFGKKLAGWTHRGLAMGGHMTLIKFVLQNISVYCMHFFMLPMEILHKIESILVRFLWSGHNQMGKMHLVRWKVIARPVADGGWGILDTFSFNTTQL